jgi:hypothetical protein
MTPGPGSTPGPIERASAADLVMLAVGLDPRACRRGAGRPGASSGSSRPGSRFAIIECSPAAVPLAAPLRAGAGSPVPCR